MRYAMVIDMSRCIGCHACTAACKVKNGTPPGIFYTKVLQSEVGSYPKVRLSFQPVLCMHCNDAACVDVCPTGATQKLDNGIVAVDQNKCIGCRYCMAACPFNARYFNFGQAEEAYPGKGLTPYEQVRSQEHAIGTVGKCDFCQDRLAQGKQPACVQACVSGARIFGDLDDPNSEVSHLIVTRGGYQLHPELGTDPSVYYLPG
jgi:Fe-S-cluster-containing dehydrogenase component